MLFYSNLNSKKYCKIGLVNFSSILQDECSENFLQKIFCNCNLALIRDVNFMPLMMLPLIREYWFVLPRNEDFLDELILVWHKELDQFCIERGYAVTKEQAKIIEEMTPSFDLGAEELINIITTAEAAERQGIQKHTKEMEEALEPAFIEAKRVELMGSFQIEELEEAIKRLEPKEEDKNYVNKFLRGIDPEKFRLNTPLFSPIKTPNIYIDLMPYREFLTEPITTSFWAIQVKKKQLKLKYTRKPHKHNKYLCYL